MGEESSTRIAMKKTQMFCTEVQPQQNKDNGLSQSLTDYVRKFTKYIILVHFMCSAVFNDVSHRSLSLLPHVGPLYCCIECNKYRLLLDDTCLLVYLSHLFTQLICHEDVYISKTRIFRSKMIFTDKREQIAISRNGFRMAESSPHGYFLKLISQVLPNFIH